MGKSFFISLLLALFCIAPAQGEPVYESEDSAPPKKSAPPLDYREDDARYEGRDGDAPVLKTRKKPQRGRWSPRPRRQRESRYWQEEPTIPDPVDFGTLNRNSFSLMLHTPLIAQNTFDSRFQSFGMDFLFSAALTRMGNTGYLHGELGVGFTLSRLNVPPVVNNFTHIYFQIPFRLRLLVPIDGDKIVFEAIGGLQARIFEYDSRDTTDGGFFLASGGILKNLDPNIGFGLNFSLTDALNLRVLVEYINLSVGVEF